MQRKFIKRKELEKNITSEEDVIFLDSSPSLDISFPPKTVAAAIHGNWTGRGIQGTFYVFREDTSDTVLLNTDEYSFNASHNEEESEMIGPLKTEYHHIDDIPSFLKSQAPKRVIDRLQQISDRRFRKV